MEQFLCIILTGADKNYNHSIFDLNFLTVINFVIVNATNSSFHAKFICILML
jgi:hypothetical protein